MSTVGPKPRGECPVCGLDYQLTKDGILGRHNGMTAAGFSTGERCLGVGEPPFVPEGA
ncbi:hypothetical protein [Streptomyces sp. ITFR-6]|uniref:hypothetical protein n=1 Tax=Streptomyces sp. ITFR-6 TaxID=3075197 RepID=UPI00288BDCAA|nr:hypothetical protein [Streptomyces sp. ITFR-6]WNI31470.1 hypothetical protein RLT59_23775 [Streptomyces sp. ITFR-6]